jgi:hypothetical protein
MIKTIEEKLEDAFGVFIMETSREPKLILMHPQLWVKFVKEIEIRNGFFIEYQISHGFFVEYPIEFRGIKVLRSWDLNEDEFQMY